MKATLRENLIKNIVLIILLIIGYFIIQDSFNVTNFSDKIAAGNFLVAISILAVTACFGNFAFTYEKVANNLRARYLAHITTGILMLLIGLSLEMTAVLVQNFVGDFPVFNFSLMLLYIGSVLFDFWDIQRSSLG